MNSRKFGYVVVSAIEIVSGIHVHMFPEYDINYEPSLYLWSLLKSNGLLKLMELNLVNICSYF
jgi:hypothetical protein